MSESCVLAMLSLLDRLEDNSELQDDCKSLTEHGRGCV